MRIFHLNLRVALFAVSFLALIPSAHAQWTPINPVTTVKQQPDAVLISMLTGVMRVQFCSDSIIHVTYSPTSSIPDEPQFIVNKTNWSPVQWSMQATNDQVKLSTLRMSVVVTRKNSWTLFSDSAGNRLFEERNLSMTPAVVNGKKTYHSEMFSDLWDSTEAFYGLGQHQAGVWNYHGESVDLGQDNTNISVPFFISSNGYGLLWNNASLSRFNNRFLHALYLSSQAADTLDFYIVYGPDFDHIVAGYRELTGAAPLFGKWAYGFWQCKNRYGSQAEILAIAKKYRDLHIPADNIVQDWFWWNVMGEPVFNKNYPDPKGMIDDLHQDHFHIMFSYWAFFRKGSSVYDDMDKRGYFIDRTIAPAFHPTGMAIYDPFNPDARKYYWGLLNTLYQMGADAWWLDSDEPESEHRETNILATDKVALGNGADYANMFPLMHTAGVYEGQRAASDQKRVFILSRSAFAGIQRNSVAAWSGDVESNWLNFRRQIPAGLNFELSGIPYWTTDIGGFVSGNPDDPSYRELFVRWFEYGAFCPIFRVHGTRATNSNELWSYGPQAQEILTSFDRLRYRLMPYIYSVAWMTTSKGYTPMRPLVMDFRTDVTAQNIADQFSFGPSILVNPVTEAGATSRHLYLPDARWYDFWDGTSQAGGKWIDAPAPLDRIPLYVRAGSILPVGPEIEYTTEKPADPIELRVYPGAEAEFTLYEDENDTYDYEKGAFATIPLRWDDVGGKLTIGDRSGKFPGMLEKRTFRVVFVRDNHGAGSASTPEPDKVVDYSGSQVTVSR